MAPGFALLPPPLPLPLQPRLMLWLLLLLPPLLVPGASPAPAPVRYDQRQTGKVNVQVDLKDVEIYAILDESLLAGLGVGDYDYDYSQLTEKPPATSVKPPSTTTKPPSSSSKPPSSKPGSSSTQAPASPASSTKKPSSVRTSELAREATAERSNSDTGPAAVSVGKVGAVGVTNAAVRATPAPEAAAPAAPQRATTAAPVKISVAHRRCGAGYHRDASGRCRRNRRPFVKYSQRRRPASRSAAPAAEASSPITIINAVPETPVKPATPPAAADSKPTAAPTTSARPDVDLTTTVAVSKSTGTSDPAEPSSTPKSSSALPRPLAVVPKSTVDAKPTGVDAKSEEASGLVVMVDKMAATATEPVTAAPRQPAEKSSRKSSLGRAPERENVAEGKRPSGVVTSSTPLEAESSTNSPTPTPSPVVQNPVGKKKVA